MARAWVVFVGWALLSWGACGGTRQAGEPDAGGADSAMPIDVGGGVVDAGSDVVRFPGGSVPQRRGAVTATARVFATLPFGGSIDWLRVAGDGSIVVGGVLSFTYSATFYGSAPISVTSGPGFVARLDRMGNTVWASGYGSDSHLTPPGLLGDGAIVVAAPGGLATAPSAAVWRINADNTAGWSKDFGQGGAVFYSATATADDDVILVGTAAPTADLDPGPGTAFTSKFGPFVMALSGSTGDLLWVRTPTDAAWLNPFETKLRSDGRLVGHGLLAADKSVEVLFTLASDGTADAGGWLHKLANGLEAWTLLPNQDVLVADALAPPNEADSTLRLLDGATGAARSAQPASGNYRALETGPTRVAGVQIARMQTSHGLMNYWLLDWWTPDGVLEGGLQWSPDPNGYGQEPRAIAIDASGRIIVGVTIQAPAGTVVDLDPGPGVTAFTTPNDGTQLAVIELAP